MITFCRGVICGGLSGAREERHGRQTMMAKTLKKIGRGEKGDGVILESWKQLRIEH